SVRSPATTSTSPARRSRTTCGCCGRLASSRASAEAPGSTTARFPSGSGDSPVCAGPDSGPAGRHPSEAASGQGCAGRCTPPRSPPAPASVLPSALLHGPIGSYIREAGVRCERLGNADAAVLLLVLLENRDEGTSDRQTRAVERRGVLALALAGAVPDTGSAGLEGGAVGDAGDLAVAVLAGEPDLDVVGELGGETDVARGQRHDAVGKAELAEAGFSVAQHDVEFLCGILGPADSD